MPDMKRCSFCRRPANEVKALVQGADGPEGAHICNRCIGNAADALNRDSTPKEEVKERPVPNPREIKKFFDDYVIAQDRAKTDVAVAVYKHYRRREAMRKGGLLADSDLAKVEVQKSNILMMGPSGCHRRGQKVIMFDGTLKAVEDVRVGDQLMGPDSTPRRVLELHHGVEKMVEISPSKGKPWVVNEGHILTLVQTGKKSGGRYRKLNKVKDVALRSWLQWSRTKRATHKLFRVPVDFPHSTTPLPIDPYFLGVLLGDGSLYGTPRVTNESPEVVKEVHAQAKRFDLRVSRHEDKSDPSACPMYALAGDHGGVHEEWELGINPLALALAGLDLWNVKCGSKFIPHRYLTSSRRDRLELLAGLIDTDGSLSCNGFDFINKSKALVDDVAFLARSLGFAAYPKPSVKKSQNGTAGLYFRLFISGHTDQIPVRIKEKRAQPRRQIKDVLRVGFHTKSLPPEEYFGFVLDGDHRYLLDDFTVTHNTGKTEIARTVAKLLNVPFYVADATKFTSAGYVGDDVESMIQGLIADAGNDIERAQWGVIFIDEIDKIARKSGRGASGYRDVTGEGAQQAMLKIIEGDKVSVPRNMQKAGIGAPSDLVDTTNILFIAAGSFAGGIDEIVKRRVNKKAAIGFGVNKTRRDLSDEEIYGEAIEEDILEFGIIPELAGRLPVLTTTLPLTEEQMVRVLTEPKNAIAKQFRAQFAMDGIDLTFEDEALLAIGRKAKERPTGARALRSIMEDVLQKYVFEHAGDKTIKSIRITEAVVEEGAEAVVTRRSEGEEPERAIVRTA